MEILSFLENKFEPPPIQPMRVQEHTEKNQHGVAAVIVQILYEAIEQSNLQKLVV